MEDGLRAGDQESVDAVEAEAPLRCVSCGIDVADREAVAPIGGHAAVETFVNPAGALFEVVTVAVARNLVVHGPGSTAFTWFVGYAWSIVTCSSCAAHLGWSYDAVTSVVPTRFVALICSRVS